MVSTKASLCLRLSKLQAIRNKDSELLLLPSRAAEVLQEITAMEWEQYRPVCEEQLAVARQFWSQTEGLIIEIVNMDAEVDESLLSQCQGLLAVCDRWVSSEEEILELNDLSADTYVLAHEQRDLVWQKA
jgi:hypothetical protein